MFSTNQINADMALGLISEKISSNSCHCGIALSSLKLPEKCFALGIIRNNEIILASADPTIWYGDEILAVALNSATIPMLKFVLKKTHPVHYSCTECPINNLPYSQEQGN
jgi:Trk K+ transport system NAD-binding subunit